MVMMHREQQIVNQHHHGLLGTGHLPTGTLNLQARLSKANHSIFSHSIAGARVALAGLNVTHRTPYPEWGGPEDLSLESS